MKNFLKYVAKATLNALSILLGGSGIILIYLLLVAVFQKLPLHDIISKGLTLIFGVISWVCILLLIGYVNSKKDY